MSRKERFSLSELSAPPPDTTPAGRANRKGEPVLYVASDDETALAEVRAWKGAAVAVGRMRLRKPCRVIDLLQPKLPDSPFFNEHLFWEMQKAGLFYRLAEELSRPVVAPDCTDKDMYRPTQHLCDLIREAGYDGVVYTSAMGSGSNLVLFDSNAAAAIELAYKRVGVVWFDYEIIPPNCEVYEEGRFDHLLRRIGSQ